MTNSSQVNRPRLIAAFTFFRAAVLLICLLAPLGLGLASPGTGVAQSPTRSEKPIVGEDGWIYGNAAAMKLVQEARKHDPMFCPEKQRDREKAVALYEQAIDAQPGAKVNAAIANRVGQLYGYYGDGRRVIPDLAKARRWWSRCVELSSPNQLVWAQAQIGLASIAVTGGDCELAATAYGEILKRDASETELDDWRFQPTGDSDQANRQREFERKVAREQVAEIQAVAAKNKPWIEKVAEQRKAVEEVPHEQPKPPRWNHWKSLVIGAWVTLIAIFVWRRTAKRNEVS